MMYFFSDRTSKKADRRDYFTEKINTYRAFNKMDMTTIDFDDSATYREVEVDYLIDFYEFIYKYVRFYVADGNDVSSETVMSVLCLCVPQGNQNGVPLSLSLEQTRMRLGENLKANRKEAEVYRLYDRIVDGLTLKNTIDAIKIFYHNYIIENTLEDAECSAAVSFFQNEMNRVFQNCIANSPRFSYQKDMYMQAGNSPEDPNANMLDLSYEEIVKQVDKFLQKNSPKTIYEYLCKHIVGQEHAKRQISIGVYYYLQKIVNPKLVDTNNNMLMVGPSGCGKTEIIRVLQKFLPIPVIIYDISSLTSAGYKGDNKDNILRPLVGTEGVALVFLDEFDKICAPNITATGTNFSYETQGQILSMIEGNTIPIDDGEAYINTRNTLFIAGGAYEDMEIESKKKFIKQKTIGFGTVSNNDVDENSRDYRVAITDVIKYGLRVELAGRFASVITLYPLTDEELHGVVRKYVSYYENMINKTIVFDKEDLNKEIKTNKLGCRHIKQIIYDILTDALFEAPAHPEAKKVKITKNDKEFKTAFA